MSTRRSTHALPLRAISLVLLLSFSLYGCSSKNVVKNSIGDTVGTDVLSVTLDRAEFATALTYDVPTEDYLDGTLETTEYGLPKEYDPEEDEYNPYVAAQGQTLIPITFTVENLDRTNIIFGSSNSNGWGEKFITVQYNGVDYPADIENSGNFDERDFVEYVAESKNGNLDLTYYLDGLSLDAGDVATYRAYILLPVEVDSFEDSFDITFNVPNSEGSTTPFVYEVQ